jgi:WD40 repeat protein/serine/threonine protein kinase
MSSLFLSYRRADSPGTVKYLFDRLKSRLPRWTLFYDHKVLLPGEVLSERLRYEVTSAEVVLCVIGPRWLDLLKERRDRPEIDHVREEVRLALSAGHTVIPLLVENAPMPREADLADFPELKPLCRLIGQSVRPEPDFDADLERLAAFLDQLGPGIGAGTVLGGKYKIHRAIGQGGMGVVYEAEQQTPRRIVAIKMVLEGMDTKEVLARFDGEKEALARMDHPNIARVIDSGSSPGGKPYFVMEFVRGEPITNYCDRKRLLPKDRLKLFRQVCSAVQHAHQKGIIHRDIKPSNVLVEEIDGQLIPKVIDFGLAKALAGRLTDRTLISETGKTVGTLIYASPEQAAGRQYDIDTRTDIYSLGALLYELLVGAPPFTQEKLKQIGDEAMCRAIIETEPSKPSTNLSSSNALPIIAANRHLEPLKLIHLVRGELDWIAMRALEKEPKRRYETASQFSDDIEHYLNDEPVEACPPSAGYKLRKFVHKHRAALTTAAAFALLLVISASVSIGLAIQATNARDAARDSEAKKDRALIAVKEERDRTKQESRKANQSLSDFYRERGRTLLSDGDSRGLLWLTRALTSAPADDLERQFLTRTIISAESRRHCELKAILSCQTGMVRAVAFSPNGKTVITGSHDKTAQLWSVADGTAVGPPMAHQDSVLAVAFSPDGKTVLTGSYDKTAQLWSVADGTAVGPPMAHQDSVFAVTFSPDGKTVLTGSDDKTARLWSATDGTPIGPPMVHQGKVHAVAFSPDGKTVVTASRDKTARLWAATAGTPVGKPMVHESEVSAVTFSPDGKTILTGSNNYTSRLWSAADGSPVVTSGEANNKRLWITESDEQVGLPRPPELWVSAGAFRPDGKTVVAPSVDNTERLWSTAFGVPVGQPMVHEAGILAVAFSPDGKTLVTASRDKTARLWSAADGTAVGQTIVHQDVVGAVAFSPDSKLVVTGSWDNTARLWNAADGSPIGRPMRHNGAAYTVAFSPDGKTVLTGSQNGTARLWHAPTVMAGDPQRILLWSQVITGMEIHEKSNAVEFLDAPTWRERRRELDALGGPPLP